MLGITANPISLLNDFWNVQYFLCWLEFLSSLEFSDIHVSDKWTEVERVLENSTLYVEIQN